MASLNNKFERRIVHLKKIQNIVQLLDSSFSLHPKGEWINETVSVFQCDKVSFQMEIIEFRTEF